MTDQAVTAREGFVELDWDGRRQRVEFARVGVDDPAAPLLVFLHEGLGSVSMWRDFPQQMAQALGWRGLVYSRPAYGRSTPKRAEDRWRPDFMHRQAQEVLPQVLAALGHAPSSSGERLWLFGHSDGGSIALLHAAAFPDQVAGLVVCAPHLFVEALTVASIEEAREAYASTDLRAKLAKYHDDPDSAFRGWNDIWLDPDFLAWNIEAEVASVRCPVLAVQGQDDQYGTMAQIDRIAQGLPAGQVELLKLDACGHSPHRDQPKALIDRVVDFVHRRAGPDSRSK
ncbi:alpha/beta fold hydrolase [Sphaerotilus microaerophilus]|uniref:Alpha/beta hydrolase n=1 Tax=Sphaerotilus microaerophilus TaxID=2914710 RepID=A0ABN6PGL4_9BURK|nr:alpha/beta hydrolase [Sphaerotilus sp. FB-5]BDI04139.1 alpha/beta hydrolase [Sphaerotilus sp. FB-5]